MDTIQYQFFVPKESYLFSQGIEPDIVVVINKLFFSREPEEFIQEIPYATAGSNPAGGANMYHYKYTTDYLVGDVLFVIWDYKKNDVITYGHFYDETLPFINMTKSTWHKSFENIADRIFLFSPFKWEYDYKKMIKKINTKDKIWKHNE